MNRSGVVRRHQWPAFVSWGCFFVVYGLLVLLSLRLTNKPDQSLSIWLPNGVAMAVLVFAAKDRRLPVLAVACFADFAANLVFGNGPVIGGVYTLANMCQIAAGTALILCIKGRAEPLNGLFGMARDVLPATLVTPLIGMGVVAAITPTFGLGGLREGWEQWYLAGALGLFTILPPALAVTPDRVRQLLCKSSLLRFLCIVGCLLVVTVTARLHVFPPILILNVSLIIGALLLPLLGSLLVNALAVIGSAVFTQEGIIKSTMAFHDGFDPSRYLGLALTVIPSVMVAVLIESLRTTEQRLIEATKRAKASEAAKAMFLAVMSHEIRSPLNSIIGFTSLLWEREQAGRNRELIEPIRTAGEILLNVINDILDFSKFESGRLELEEISFSPEACLRQVEVLFTEKAREKDLAFRVFVDENVPSTLVGDAHRLRQVLINLVSNAIKFTAKGSVEVRLTADTGGGEARRLEFLVSDTGIGIPADQFEKIFERFSQVDSSTARRFGGTGLGLAISKSVAQAMGGNLWFESRVGEGSVFHLHVSFKMPSTQSLRPLQDLPPATPVKTVSDLASRLRILVVDDNKVNSRLATLLLKRIGISRIDTAHDGSEALKAVNSAVFDVVLMDCQMPVMDGFETAGRIREMEKAAAVRRPLVIIALTAAVLPEDRKRAVSSGMDDFVEKPINQAALVEALERAATRASGR